MKTEPSFSEKIIQTQFNISHDYKKSNIDLIGPFILLTALAATALYQRAPIIIPALIYSTSLAIL